ncbi:hypothetical protein [Paenibacillus sp. JJ1722]|uniref:hypothetical protein n=1 Tax=Paenibacillus sp. JJ1722 TaxID=3398770 RepID=UPI003AAC732C
MITVSTFKNIQLQDFNKFLEANPIPEWKEKIKADTINARYIAIHKLFTDEINAEKRSVSNETIDAFLFEHLFYTYKNYQYVYRFDDFKFTAESSIDSVRDYLSERTELCYNRLLTEQANTDNFTLHTTRIEEKAGKLISLNFLMKIADIRTMRFPEVDVYVAIKVDLVNSMILLKFNLTQLELLNSNATKILIELKRILNGQTQAGHKFEPLNINLSSLNEKDAKKTIFKLFEELSLDAEDIINAHAPSEADVKISKFLDQMGLSEIKSDYIQQIKAVIYQEISSALTISDFKNGWVYRFTFREGLTTKASSRTDDYSPIYNSKIYWHLKELIFKEEEMQEAGLHYTLPNPPDGSNYVLVRLESRSDCIIINYYHRMRYNRKGKEEFVLQKLNKHLPK